VLEALAGGCGLLVADTSRPGYDLWLEDPSQAAAFEKSLRQNPYFNQALALRQLAPLRVRELRGDWLFRLSHELAARRGCRLGDVKLPALISGIPAGEVASWLV
jgi:hypothetical protein